MSTTIATVAGTNGSGLGTDRHVVYATNSALYWAFAYTGTNVLSSWYSADNVSWTAGATHTLANAHNSEGRNLGVGIASIGAIDVIMIGLAYKVSTDSIGQNVLRATVAGTTLTYHTSETVLDAGQQDFGSLFWTGVAVDISGNNEWLVGSGWAITAGSYGGSMCYQVSSVDPGTAEQMTPLTWTEHGIDNSQVAEPRSFYFVSTGGSTWDFLADNGSTATTTTGIEWDTGSANTLVTGSITAIDKNDWGAVLRNFTDVHAVYRSAAGALVHRRWDGTSWGAGQTIPSGASPASGIGIALSTDGLSVWLTVIDSDASNTVRTVRWTDGYRNGSGTDAWDAAWTAVETSTQTRTWLGTCRDIANQTGLVYWSQGSSLVAATFVAVSPDPAYIQTAQGSSSASQSSFGVTFSTANITTGNRIIVGISMFGSGGAVISSVTDSAGNTYAKDSPACVLADGSDISIWSAPITLGGGTKPTVTVHASLTSFVWGVQVHEYAVSNATSAYLDGTAVNNASAVASPATSGASSPAPHATGELAFGFFGDTNAQASITPSAGWTLRGTAILGSGLGECCSEDQTTVAGTGSNASFAITATGASAGILVVVYKLATAIVTPNSSVAFPALSGLQSLPPQSPVLDLFSTFAQPWSAPLSVAQAAPPTVVATFMRGERVSSSSRSRSKAVLASPPTPTFTPTAPAREQKTSPSTRSRARVVLATIRAASPFPTTPNKIKPSPAVRGRSRFVLAATPAASPFATVPNRARLSPLTKARPRFVLPAAVSVVVAAPAVMLRAAARSSSNRSRTRLALPATVPVAVATVAATRLRAGLRSPSSRSRTRVVSATAPGVATIFVLRPGARSPSSRPRSRVVLVALPAASPFPVRLQARARSLYTRSHPYTTLAAPAVVVATVAAGTIRAPLRGPGLRSRSRRVVAASQTPTTGSVRALRAPTRSPASRSRSARLKPVVAPQFPPVAATMPMRMPLLPVPLRARPRLTVSPVPLARGVAAALRRNHVTAAFAKARPRFVLGANVILGVPQRRLRNRVAAMSTVARSRRVAPAIATLQPGVSPTQQRELRVT
jgi:hypothetical protein